MITALLILSAVLLALAYRFYSPRIARLLGVDFSRPTPAHELEDDVDYCPAKLPILFGHHFSSIAGAGPIVGPLIAVVYGWLPAVLWVLIGGIFVGAVHDFGALMASIRHGGRSMGAVMEAHLGRTGKRLFLTFLWAAMVLLVGAYLAIVAKTFSSVPAAATASSCFIPLALLFGVALYKLKLPVLPATLVGVILLAGCMVAGWFWPLAISTGAWTGILIAYTVAASVLPVWLLLQPRDYLNSFLLYALLLLAIVGILAAQPATELPAFTGFFDSELGPLFPILFVTIACGAVSGYHSVVSGGTSAKQLDREVDARPIGYGAMLVESLVAIIVIAVAMRLSAAEYSFEIAAEGPVALFANGIGHILSALHAGGSLATDFAALAISAFILTTLDTATRLARFAFQEFFAPKEGEQATALTTNRYVATGITVAAAAGLAFSDGWKAIWPIFGAANQLLAAFAFLAISLWLRSRAVKSRLFTIPMYFMFAVTVSALVVLVWEKFSRGEILLGAIGALLLGLSGVLISEAVRASKGFRRPD